MTTLPFPSFMRDSALPRLRIVGQQTSLGVRVFSACRMGNEHYSNPTFDSAIELEKTDGQV